MIARCGQLFSKNALCIASPRNLALTTNSQTLTIRDAWDSALVEAIKHDDKILVLSEQLPGGYFLKKGNWKNYGSQKLGLVGRAVKAASDGFHPICEFRTFKFFTQVTDQIVISAPKQGNFSFPGPIVLRAPFSFSSAHGKNFSDWLNNCPFLKVLAPYDSEDCKGLLKAAIQVLKKDFVLPIGKAKIVKEGSDVTIVAYSYGVHLALEAHKQLKKENINAEIINLRSLRPLDFETISKSVKKTHRLIVVENDHSLGNINDIPWYEPNILPNTANIVKTAKKALLKKYGDESENRVMDVQSEQILSRMKYAYSGGVSWFYIHLDFSKQINILDQVI
uniref:Pyruvate dehydrogenase E1 component subunit beta n=1 Tax=Panagrolaimus davidi TaxID=227884 RepID=A0A914QDS0_9BILA